MSKTYKHTATFKSESELHDFQSKDNINVLSIQKIHKEQKSTDDNMKPVLLDKSEYFVVYEEVKPSIVG
jgi:hypothetical protein